MVAAKAACAGLLTGHFPDPVTIRLPRGEEPGFALAEQRLAGWLHLDDVVVADRGDLAPALAAVAAR